MLNELHEKAKTRGETKVRLFAEKKKAEMKAKLDKLHEKTKRGEL